jgi:hypothetical protein
MISRRAGVWLLAGVTVAVIAAALLAPRTPQPEAYHFFADQRELAGLPRFGIAERIRVRIGLYVWPFLVLLGAGSVLQWYWSELREAGDLRFYAAVQVYAIAVMLVALLLPARYTRSSDLAVVTGSTCLLRSSLADISSVATRSSTVAAGAGYWILRML